jgi:hypothetical protein
LTCQNSTTDEMLDSLSEEQQELLMYTIRDIYKHAGEVQGKNSKGEQRQLIEALANDEELLNILTEMLERVKIRQRTQGIGIYGPNGTMGATFNVGNYPMGYPSSNF